MILYKMSHMIYMNCTEGSQHQWPLMDIYIAISEEEEGMVTAWQIVLSLRLSFLSLRMEAPPTGDSSY